MNMTASSGAVQTSRSQAHTKMLSDPLVVALQKDHLASKYKLRTVQHFLSALSKDAMKSSKKANEHFSEHLSSSGLCEMAKTVAGKLHSEEEVNAALQNIREQTALQLNERNDRINDLQQRLDESIAQCSELKEECRLLSGTVAEFQSGARHRSLATQPDVDKDGEVNESLADGVDVTLSQANGSIGEEAEMGQAPLEQRRLERQVSELGMLVEQLRAENGTYRASLSSAQQQVEDLQRQNTADVLESLRQELSLTDKIGETEDNDHDHQLLDGMIERLQGTVVKNHEGSKGRLSQWEQRCAAAKEEAARERDARQRVESMLEEVRANSSTSLRTVELQLTKEQKECASLRTQLADASAILGDTRLESMRLRAQRDEARLAVEESNQELEDLKNQLEDRRQENLLLERQVEDRRSSLADHAMSSGKVEVLQFELDAANLRASNAVQEHKQTRRMLHNWIANAPAMQAQLSGLSDSCKTLKQALAQTQVKLQQDIMNACAALDTQRMQCQEQCKAEASLNAEIGQVKLSAVNLADRNSQLGEQVILLQEERSKMQEQHNSTMSKLQIEFAKQQEQLDKARLQFSSSQSMVSALQSKLDEQAKECNDKLDAMAAAMQRVKDGLKQQTAAESRSREEISKAHERYNACAKELQDCRDLLLNAHRDKDAVQVECTRTSEAFAAQREAMAVQAEKLTEAEAEIERLKAEVASSMDNVQRQRNEALQAAQRCAAISKAKEESDDEIVNLQSKLSRLQIAADGLQNSLADSIEAEKKVERKLHENEAKIIRLETKEREMNVQWMAKLSESAAATKRLQDSLDTERSIREGLQTQLSEAKNHAMISREELRKVEFAAASDISRSKQEIEELKDSLASVSVECNSLRLQCASLHEQLAGTKFSEEKQLLASPNASASSVLSENLSGQVNTSIRSHSDDTMNSSLSGTLQRQIADANNKLSQWEAELKSLRAQLRAAEQNLHQEQQRADAAERERASISLSLRQSEESIHLLSAQCRDARDNLSEAKLSLQSMKSQNEHLVHTNAELSIQADEMQTHIRTLERVSKLSERERDEARRQTQSIREQMEEADAKWQEVTKGLRAQLQQLNEGEDCAETSAAPAPALPENESAEADLELQSTVTEELQRQLEEALQANFALLAAMNQMSKDPAIPAAAASSIGDVHSPLRLTHGSSDIVSTTRSPGLDLAAEVMGVAPAKSLCCDLKPSMRSSTAVSCVQALGQRAVTGVASVVPWPGSEIWSKLWTILTRNHFLVLWALASSVPHTPAQTCRQALLLCENFGVGSEMLGIIVRQSLRQLSPPNGLFQHEESAAARIWSQWFQLYANDFISQVSHQVFQTGNVGSSNMSRPQGDLTAKFLSKATALHHVLPSKLRTMMCDLFAACEEVERGLAPTAICTLIVRHWFIPGLSAYNSMEGTQTVISDLGEGLKAAVTDQRLPAAAEQASSASALHAQLITGFAQTLLNMDGTESSDPLLSSTGNCDSCMASLHADVCSYFESQGFAAVAKVSEADATNLHQELVTAIQVQQQAAANQQPMHQPHAVAPTTVQASSAAAPTSVQAVQASNSVAPTSVQASSADSASAMQSMPSAPQQESSVQMQVAAPPPGPQAQNIAPAAQSQKFEGFLDKKRSGFLRKGWHQVWCVIFSGKLSMFGSKAEAEGLSAETADKAKSILLTGSSFVLEDLDKGKFPFTVHEGTQGATVTLAAHSEAGREQWCQQLLAHGVVASAKDSASQGGSKRPAS